MFYSEKELRTFEEWRRRHRIHNQYYSIVTAQIAKPWDVEGLSFGKRYNLFVKHCHAYYASKEAVLDRLNSILFNGDAMDTVASYDKRVEEELVSLANDVLSGKQPTVLSVDVVCSDVKEESRSSEQSPASVENWNNN